MKDLFYIPTARMHEAFQMVIDDEESSEFIKQMSPETFIECLNDKHIQKQFEIHHIGADEDGGYQMTGESFYLFVNHVVSIQLNKDLQNLVKLGMLELYWDDSKNDFVFKSKVSEE